MANALYDLGRNSFLRGEIVWQTDTIKVVLVDAGAYTPNLATHQFLSDIPGGARIATSAALTSKTTVAGVADAADPVFVGATGVQSEYLVVYQDTGSAATSRLIVFIDTATGLPVTPNSGDINVIFSASGIFKL
jgi:hypothetical protein